MAFLNDGNSFVKIATNNIREGPLIHAIFKIQTMFRFNLTHLPTLEFEQQRLINKNTLNQWTLKKHGDLFNLLDTTNLNLNNVRISKGGHPLFFNTYGPHFGPNSNSLVKTGLWETQGVRKAQ